MQARGKRLLKETIHPTVYKYTGTYEAVEGRRFRFAPIDQLPAAPLADCIARFSALN